MIIVQMGDPDGAGPNGARGTPSAVGGSDRSTGNFKRNRAGLGQRSPNYYQRTPCGDVHSRRKLERFPVVLVPTSDENRNRELKPRPLALFLPRGVRTQSNQPKTRDKHPQVPQIGGQTTDHQAGGVMSAENA